MKLEKLQSLAKNLSSLLPSDVSNINEISHWLGATKKKYSVYFDRMDITDYLKLLFCIWSFKTTNSFKLSDKILNELFFVTFFTTELEQYIQDCEDCDGSGRVSCDLCDGYGSVDCDECSGSGMIDCDECNGEGDAEVGDEIVSCDSCDGAGETECSVCGGDGRSGCDQCDGSGNMDCNTCGGDGMVGTNDEVTYELKTYASWNKNLKNVAEMRLNTSDGLSYDQFVELTDENSFLISFSEEHGVPAEFIESDLYYITDFNDDAADLNFGSDGSIVTYHTPDEYTV